MSTFEVKISSGPSQSRSIKIGSEPIVFGRTDAADVVLGHDHSTSSRHFQLSVADGKLLLLDLGSKNGTSVNGQRVEACQLVAGDQIQAGFTSLTVHKRANTPFESSAGLPLKNNAARQGNAVPQSTAGPQGNAIPAQNNAFDPFGSYYAPPKKAAATGSSGAVVRQKQDQAPFAAVRSQCASETVCLTGRVPEDSSISDLLERLTPLGSIYWIVDFTHFAEPLPEGLDLVAGCLFPWLPDDAAGRAPQLLACDELPNWKSFVEQAWGHDGIIALQSDSDKNTIVAELRRLVRDPSLPGRSRGVNGYCWPSVLAAMLDNDPAGFAEPFLDIVKLAVVETPDASGWQLFTRDEKLIAKVEQQGVRIAPDELQRTRST